MAELQEKTEMKKMKLSNLSKMVAISIIVYSCILVIHGIVVYFLDTEFSIMISDQLVFYNRGVGVLRGDVPYRDFYTHAAPLSPYLWAPIVFISMLFTGNFSTEGLVYDNYLDSPSMMFSSYIFRVFFVFCLILSAVLLYKILEMKGNKKSFWITLCYSVNPYFLYLVSFWGSDECIVPLLIVLPIYLLEKEKYYFASLSLIIGTGLKYFPILLLPLFLIYKKNLRNGIIQILLILLGITASYLPFYLIDSVEFLKQFNYPSDFARNQGLVAFLEYFTNSAFTVILNYVFLAVTISFVGITGLLLFLRKKRWSFEKTIALLLPFLLFFPKIHFSYFVLIFPFIFVMIFRNETFSIIYALIFLGTILGGTAADYILSYDGTNILSYISSWIITVILYVSLISALIHNYLDKNLELTSLGKTTE
ncbi:MAG: DUF2029 domain-containing protein [Candidatus Heimdallarchaeota archaeon]|nr:DUF2029 domain-containing protein [Candidatus Heimdallarchaeota archaeon]